MVTDTAVPTKGRTQAKKHAVREKSATPATKFVARQTHTTVTETTTVRTRIVREKKFPRHPSSTVQLRGRDESTYPLANKELPQELRRIQWTNPDLTSGSYEVLDNSDTHLTGLVSQENQRGTSQRCTGTSRHRPLGYSIGRRNSPSLQLKHESNGAGPRKSINSDHPVSVHQIAHRRSKSTRNSIPQEQTEQWRYPSLSSGSGLATPGVCSHPRQPTRPADQLASPAENTTNDMLPTPTLEHERAMTIEDGSTINGDITDEPSLVISMSDVSDRTLSRTTRHSAVPTPPTESIDSFLLPLEMHPDTVSTSTGLRSSRSPSEPNGTLPSPGPSVAASDVEYDSEGAQTDVCRNARQPRLQRSVEPQHRHSTTYPTLHSAYESPMATDTESSEDDVVEMSQTTPNLSRLPSIQAFFDRLPSEMQKYAIHQLLQCCDRTVLHFVANTVNPVLKCDPMKKLPAELGLQILGYLDVQALCRAAQVSRQWRSLVNSEDQLWKQHFEDGGFQLQDGEAERAVREGWGWQDPGDDGCEEDMRRLVIASPSLLDNDQSEPLPRAGLRRSKRKATSELLGG